MTPEFEVREFYETFPRTDVDVMRHRSLSTELLSDGKPRGGQNYYGGPLTDWPSDAARRDGVLRHMEPRERFSPDFVLFLAIDACRLTPACPWATITVAHGPVPEHAPYVGSILRLEGETITRIYRFKDYDYPSAMHLASWVD